MQIKQLHAHFLISIGDYSNERIGFSVTLEEDETPEDIIPQLREKAKSIVGPSNSDLYVRRQELINACYNLERKLETLKAEWNATAEFLRAQGIKPEAPSMPQFQNLLRAAKVESESVANAEFADDSEGGF